MNKVDDRFAGHMAEGDPRGPLFVAAGCTWPTCPALKYRAISDNATEDFSQLNGDGVLLEFFLPVSGHDLGLWTWNTPTLPFELLAAVKAKDPDNPFGYLWSILIQFDGIGEVAQKVITSPQQKCNVTAAIGEMETENPANGTSGDTFRLEQVEWDQTEPPD